jgi:hypothetical protein
LKPVVIKRSQYLQLFGNDKMAQNIQDLANLLRDSVLHYYLGLDDVPEQKYLLARALGEFISDDVPVTPNMTAADDLKLMVNSWIIAGFANLFAEHIAKDKEQVI